MRCIVVWYMNIGVSGMKDLCILSFGNEWKVVDVGRIVLVCKEWSWKFFKYLISLCWYLLSFWSGLGVFYLDVCRLYEYGVIFSLDKNFVEENRVIVVVFSGLFLMVFMCLSVCYNV